MYRQRCGWVKGGGHSEMKKSRSKEVTACYLPLAQDEALFSSLRGNAGVYIWFPKGSRVEREENRRQKKKAAAQYFVFRDTSYFCSKRGIHLCQSPGLD